MSREILEVVIGGLGVSAAYLAIHNFMQFRERTLDEVVGFLRHLDWEELNQLFDSSAEAGLTRFGMPLTFRRSQRVRLDKAAEFLERMQYDNRLLFQWASTEYKDMRSHHLDYDPQTLDSILQLIGTTRRFRRIVFHVILKIRLLSLLHFDKFSFLPIPSIAGLRNTGRNDLLHAFQAVRKAAVALAAVYGEEYQQEIATAI